MSFLDYLISPWTDPDLKHSSDGNTQFTLDGVRGLAVLIVVASHAEAFGMYGQGLMGVQMFFTLSGFVLALPFADRPARIARLSTLASFVANRALRIVPVYIVALIVIAGLNNYGADWFFKNATFEVGWSHLWSVAEFVRFYALFPFVIALLAIAPWRWLRILMLAIMIYFAWRWQNVVQIDMMGGNLVEFLFYFFLTGVLACFLGRALSGSANGRVTRSALAILSGTILFCIFTSSDEMAAHIWRPLYLWLPRSDALSGVYRFAFSGEYRTQIWCGMFGLLLLSITVSQRSLASWFFQLWWLRHVGLLSYSLYLFHVPVMTALEPYKFQSTVLFAATFIVSYVIAIATYLAIEKPFLMLKPARPVRFRNDPVVSVALEPNP